MFLTGGAGKHRARVAASMLLYGDDALRACCQGRQYGREASLAASPGKRLSVLGSLSLMQCLFYCCRRDALVVEVNE